jgi:hypothetical protein
VPQPLTNNIWTRVEWQQKRDELKVPKGATKVSMGDALDKFHKANAKGAREGMKALTELKRVCSVYRTTVAKNPKYKPLGDKIERTLEYNINSYAKSAQLIESMIPKYSKAYEAAATELRQAAVELMNWEKAGKKGTFKPTNLSTLTKKLQELLFVVEKMPFVTDRIKVADAKVFDRTFYAFSGGAVNAATINSLVDQLKKFPTSG